jgi:hypothetical protein
MWVTVKGCQRINLDNAEKVYDQGPNGCTVQFVSGLSLVLTGDDAKKVLEKTNG